MDLQAVCQEAFTLGQEEQWKSRKGKNPPHLTLKSSLCGNFLFGEIFKLCLGHSNRRVMLFLEGSLYVSF